MEMIKLLIIREADMKAVDWIGMSSLMFATILSSRKIVSLLITNQANVNYIIQGKASVLQIFYGLKDRGFMKILIINKANFLDWYFKEQTFYQSISQPSKCSEFARGSIMFNRENP